MRDTGINAHESDRADNAYIQLAVWINTDFDAAPLRHKQVLPVPEKRLIRISVGTFDISALTRRLRTEARNHIHIVADRQIAVWQLLCAFRLFPEIPTQNPLRHAAHRVSTTNPRNRIEAVIKGDTVRFGIVYPLFRSGRFLDFSDLRDTRYLIRRPGAVQ